MDGKRQLGRISYSMPTCSSAVPMRVARIAGAMIAGLGPLSASAQEPVTAFVNVAVVPMDRERVLADQTVVVRGDRIVAMGPAGEVPVPAAAVRVDGRGKFLMPGLADMHMHLGIPGSGHAEHILLLMLANGITTMRNMDYINIPGYVVNAPKFIAAEELRSLRARVAAGELLGPRIYTSGEWYTDTTKSVAQNVDAYKAAGWDFIKVHDEGGPTLDSLVEAAKRVGLPIAGHAVGGLSYALQHRFASLEHLSGYPADHISTAKLADTVDIPKVVAATRQAGTRITPTLAWGEMSTGRRMDTHYTKGWRYLPAKFRDFYTSFFGPGPGDTTAARGASPDSARVSDTMKVRHRLVRALHAAGVELLLGTDAPLFPPATGVHQELDALVRAGLTPYQALETGTRNVASYFGTLDSTGTIGVGKRADLVLLAANPLTNIRHAEQIEGVMAAGRWLPKADLERRLNAYAGASVAPGSD